MKSIIRALCVIVCLQALSACCNTGCGSNDYVSNEVASCCGGNPW